MVAHTMHGGHYALGSIFAGWPARLRRLGAALIVGLVAACAPLTERDGDVSARSVFSVGYENLSERYIEPLDVTEVILAGLDNLAALDPMIAVVRDDGGFTLNMADDPVASWPAPAADDVTGWARMSAEIVERARAVSAKMRAQSIEDLYEAVFRGALSRLDTYSRYASAAAARQRRAARDGFGGLGISIRSEAEGTVVIKVHPGTPAERAGIVADDRISLVDGRAIAGLKQVDVVSALRGPIGSRVRLTVERNLLPAPIVVTVTRDLIVLPTVFAARKRGILTVRITGFNHGTAERLADALVSAQRDMGDGLKGIVLDLRGNPGGLLDQAVAVSNLFLDKGRIISTHGRHPESEQIFDARSGDLVTDLPVVVLVNGRSASSAEIVAVALRDRRRAVVVGSASYGKGTVQTIVRLPNGGELTLTWARIFAPSGFALQDHGIIPALCTSGNADRLTALLSGLKGDRAESVRSIEEQLKWRRLNRSDPVGARAACPPSPKIGNADTTIAERLLADPALYARALQGGGTAITASLEAAR